MNLRQLPDDWLQDLLVLQDFKTRHRLRRCCRKWQHLMLTKFVNHTIILDGSCRLDLTQIAVHPFRSAMLAVQPHLHNVICQGRILLLPGAGGVTSVANVGLAHLWHFEKMTQPIHLIFVKVPDWLSYACLSCLLYSHTRHMDLKLMDIRTELGYLWHFFAVDLNNRHTMSPRLRVLAGKLTVLCNAETIQIMHRYYEANATLPTHTFYAKILLEILPPLGPDRLRTLQVVSDKAAQTAVAATEYSVRKEVESILSELPTSWGLGLPAHLPTGPIDWTELPKLVTWAHFVRTYTFGENELFESLIDNGPDTRMRKFQLACQKYMGGALPVAINGRGLFNYNVGLMPRRHPLITVVGRPIRLEKNENPSEKEVDALHKRYMEELRALFDEHKDKYGYGDQSMEYSELS